MPGNFKKEDLRIAKTYKTLLKSLLALLERRSFCKLTINDLCEEAQISRTTFYAHFNDKYDLLKYWLTRIVITRNESSKYIHTEMMSYQFIVDNKKIISNLLDDANDETLEIIQDFLISIIDFPKGTNDDGTPNYKSIVLSHFCAGGILDLLYWLKDKKFAPDLHIVNTYFFDILKYLLAWDINSD